MKKIVLLFLLAIVFSACNSQKTADMPAGQGTPGLGGQTAQAPATATSGEVPGQYELTLNPVDANSATTLYVGSKGFNAADAKIEWLVNSPLPYPGENSAMLKGGIAKKGFTVQARATIKETEVKSNIIKIRNAPPVISRAKIMPEVFKPGERLIVDVSGTDPDGDDVTFIIEWTKNGESAGSGRSIDSDVKKGDKVLIKITPFDGEDYGRSGTMSNDIRNMPPMIVDSRDFRFDGKVFTQQVSAVDPDGETLTYSLKVGPEGMKIEASTGLVTWTVPPGPVKGSYTVVVKDPTGAESSQVLNYDFGN